MEQELTAELRPVRKSVAQFRIELLLSANWMRTTRSLPSTLAPVAPESQDWRKCCSACSSAMGGTKGFKVETLDLQVAGEEAGIKSATLSVNGLLRLCGYLKAEAGVHRLVRISPFDANKRRHTSFASVFVYPELDDDVQVVDRRQGPLIEVSRPVAPEDKTSTKWKLPFALHTSRPVSS